MKESRIRVCVCLLVSKNVCALKKRVVCACAESVFLCAYVCVCVCVFVFVFVCVCTLVKIPSVHWDEKYVCMKGE